MCAQYPLYFIISIRHSFFTVNRGFFFGAEEGVVGRGEGDSPGTGQERLVIRTEMSNR